jgi:hypothetical protein
VNERSKNLLLAGCSILLALVFCEVALRLLNGVSPFDFSNFRNTRVVEINLGNAARFDRTLGWAMRDGLDGPNDPKLGTVKYGIRRNSLEQTDVRFGHILVVGSSFTAGSEVADWETWSAQLEQITGRPVNNAAVGGYGLDQVVLRAEEMLPVLRPEVLVVGLTEAAILWSGYSALGRPKPYFTIENDKLVSHNIPVPVTTSESFRANPLEPVKAYLGYSFVVNRLMTSIDPQGWHATGEKPVTRVANDPVEVGCRLLHRLKQETDALKVRTILVEEADANDVVARDLPQPNIRLIKECARSMGYQMVETFGEMRADYKRDPNELRKYYVVKKDVMGHFSKFGNRFVASKVAAALAVVPVEGRADGYKPEAFSPGEGVNLIPSSEALDAWIPVNQLADFRRMESRSNDPRPFKMAAIGPNEAHYLQSNLLDLEPGPYTLSLHARPEAVATLRI